MALLTAKTLMGLVLGIIIILVIYFVWNSVYSLLPESVTVDKQSLAKFDQLVNDMNRLKLNQEETTPIKLKSKYSILLTNKEGFNIEDKRYIFCKATSCACLCQQSSCEKITCSEINKKFKENFNRIPGNLIFLKFSYGKDGIVIDQNNNK